MLELGNVIGRFHLFDSRRRLARLLLAEKVLAFEEYLVNPLANAIFHVADFARPPNQLCTADLLRVLDQLLRHHDEHSLADSRAVDGSRRGCINCYRVVLVSPRYSESPRIGRRDPRTAQRVDILRNRANRNDIALVQLQSAQVESGRDRSSTTSSELN